MLLSSDILKSVKKNLKPGPKSVKKFETGTKRPVSKRPQGLNDRGRNVQGRNRNVQGRNNLQPYPHMW